ncbi:unnamed protein product, partial [marine sediment metagenome]
SLINIYVENKMYDKAIDEYESYLRLGADVYDRLGYLYYKTDKLEKALQMFIKAYQIHPENKNLKNNIESISKQLSDRMKR